MILIYFFIIKYCIVLYTPLEKKLQKVLEKNYKSTGWGAGQPGFPC